ncbi:hypothetical protein [Flavobacterium sp.]|uniref:hypothetical protein n=1 Tax=Flavobacterium sp. TaxID=239 RepID=UPI00260A90C7|nr:hypothetical protein [Flavobacterium sp.]
MEAINKNPLEYFLNLLEKDKSNELKLSFISGIIENIGCYADTVDEEKGIITYWDTFYDQATDSCIEGLVTYDFNKDFNSTIHSEFLKTKKSIDDYVLDIVLKGNNPKEFINHQISLLKDLFLKTNDFYISKPIVKNAIIALIKFIQEKYLTEKVVNINFNSPNLIDADDYSQYSFLWDSLNPEDTIPNLERFYNLLTQSPPLIESTKEDFIKAFTMRKVTNGIKWLVTGHNHKISKSSLFYLIDRLISDEYITNVPSALLNKKIEYLFTDSSGDKLKNIRQSKSNTSGNPAQRERIDSILDSIFS